MNEQQVSGTGVPHPEVFSLLDALVAPGCKSTVCREGRGGDGVELGQIVKTSAT